MTLLEHGRVQGGRTDLWTDGFFLLFLMPALKTITEDRIERKKKARCKKQHTSSCRDQILRNIIAADLQSDGISNRGITITWVTCKRREECHKHWLLTTWPRVINRRQLIWQDPESKNFFSWTKPGWSSKSPWSLANNGFEGFAHGWNEMNRTREWTKRFCSKPGEWNWNREGWFCSF